jgi:hypothetical protein
MIFKIKGCYFVYLAIIVLFILINIKTKEGLLEQTHSQSDCMELGKTECSNSNICIWKTDNTCQLAPTTSEPTASSQPSSDPTPSNSETNGSNYGISN